MKIIFSEIKILWLFHLVNIPTPWCLLLHWNLHAYQNFNGLAKLSAREITHELKGEFKKFKWTIPPYSMQTQGSDVSSSSRNISQQHATPSEDIEKV
jgi:hypothetical protein